MIKHQGGAIVMQEVPDEIALAINIGGCIHRCPDCHSKNLWEDKGQPLTEQAITQAIKRYKSHVTCICFMGGDHDQYALLDLCKLIHKLKLKTCLYSGYDNIGDIIKPLQNELDYLKIGRFKKECGGLNSKTTNQTFYKKDNDGVWVDITRKFWR